MAGMAQLAVFVLYMLVLLAIGAYASRFTKKDPDDFYLAGRGIGTVVLSFTLMATVVSAWGIFGIGATASGTGLGTSVFIAIMLVLISLMLAFVGDKVAKSGRVFGYVTPTEFLRDRYENDVVPVIYVIVSTVFLLAFVATQIIGGGVALEILLDIPFNVGVVIIAVIMAIYIHIAGMRGVVWSDTLQGALMFFSIIGVFIALLALVGPGELVSGVQGQDAELFSLVGSAGVWTPVYIVSFAAFFMVGVPAYPQLFQRLLAAKSRKTLKTSILLFPIIGAGVEVIGGILGVWSVGIIPQPENPDYVIPLLIDQLLAGPLAALVLSAGVAALMSTSDSILLSISSLISRDIYREYVNPEASDKREVAVTQGLLIVFIIVAALLAFARPSGIFALGTLAVAGHAALAPALFLSFFWSEATAEGAIVSAVGSATLMILYFTEVIPGEFTFGMHYGFIGTVVAFVLFVGVSLITSRPSDERVEKYLSV